MKNNSLYSRYIVSPEGTNKKKEVRCRMGGIFVFLPQWYPGNPYTAGAKLRAELRKTGSDFEFADLNIDFYNRILTTQYLKRCLQTAQQDKLRIEGLSAPTAEEKRKDAFLRCVLGNNDAVRRARERLNEAVSVFKEKDAFYDPEKMIAAKVIVNDALALISAAYYPGIISFSNYAHPALRGDVDAIETASADEKSNIFLDFYNSGVIDRLCERQPAFFLISAADYTQLLSAVTFYKLIKRRTDAPVLLGGNIITKLSRRLCRHPEIFGSWCDYLCFGDGEKSIADQVLFLQGKRTVAETPGLARAENGKVEVTPYTLSTELSAHVPPCFEQTDFSAYYSPETVVTLQLSKGCYWGKCAFCDVSYSRSAYAIKSPETAVREIEHLRDTYGVKHFLICDDSVSPAYHRRFSRLLIERNCNVSYFSMARLETGFSADLLAQMYRAGCRVIFWGYEAESPRVMAAINKGIDCAERLSILRRAHDAGIWNHVSFMIGFPGETKAEALATVETVFENLDIIDSCFLTKFSFKANARISLSPEDYGITSYVPAGEFLLDNRYDGDGLNFEEKKEISDAFRKRYLALRGDRLWPLMCTDFEHHLLYLSKYGAEYLRSYRLSFTEGVSRSEAEAMDLTL